MVGGLFTTRLGEESLRSFAREAFVRDNLPYIMGIVSLLVMILAAAVSSASAAGTMTFQTTGSGMDYTSFAWSDMPASAPVGPYYYHGSSPYSYWPEEQPSGRSPWASGYKGPARSSRGWYNQPPIATDLYPERSGPLAAGSSVTWTARATDPDGDPILYKFWLNGPSTGWSWQEMTGWTANDRWTWKTSFSDAGTSQIAVSVKDGRHAGPDGSKSSLSREYTITLPRSNAPPTATALTPSRDGPLVAGSAVTWTATAMDPDGDQIYYRFWLKGPSTGNAWKDMTGWTANDRWTWKTSFSDAGTSQIAVSVKDGRHAGPDGSKSSLSREYTITLPRSNAPPTATALTPNRDGPLVAGSAVTWTATASDPDGDQIFYRFWLKGPSTGNAWKDMTGWTTNNRWTVQTTASDVGKSSVNVWIRDGRHAGTDGWDSYQVREFAVTAPKINVPPTAAALTPSRDGPLAAGSAVTWTATAMDPDGDQIFYRFWLRGPSTGNAWKDMTGWTTNNRWTVQTTASDVGTSSVNVWIRDGRHAGTDGWDSYQVREFAVVGSGPTTNQPPVAIGLSPNREPPRRAGTDVIWTASAHDPDGDQIYYRFWLRGPSTGNAWKDMTGWTANNRWTWQTTASDVGTSSVNVWIRDGRHAGTDGWDSYQVRDFTITW